MAQQVTSPMPTPDPADELNVLMPERTLSLDGRPITVRELGFFESLRLQAPIARLVETLSTLSASSGIDLTVLHTVCAAESEATIDLLAQACDQPRDWVATLRASEGDLLLMTFWAVNADFFLQRALSVLELRRHAEVAAHATTGPTCSPP
jgi:hypothetical protein